MVVLTALFATGNLTNGPSEPERLLVLPESVDLVEGDSVRLEVRGIVGEESRTVAAQWTTTDATVAALGTGGMVYAFRAGSAVLRATSVSLSAERTVNVYTAASMEGEVEGFVKNNGAAGLAARILVFGVSPGVVGDSHRTRAALDGHFVVRHVRRGTYVVRASHTGYQPADERVVILPGLVRSLTSC